MEENGKFIGVEYRSWWIKSSDDDYCKDMSVVGKNVGNNKWQFEFHGYNPFPCFSMISTYGVLVDWLEKNGWKRTAAKTKKTVTYENHTFIEYL